MTSDPRAQFTKHAAAIEAWMLPLFQKAPHLPQNARQTVVDVAPWLALIGGVLGLAAVFSASAFTSMLFTFSFFRYGIFPLLYVVSMLCVFAAALLELMAYQPLTQRRKAGWNFMFYALLINVVSFVLSIFAGYGNGGHIIGLLVGFWLLFEVRDAYKA
ncbi:MAG TPA: hypothetical protein PKV72_01680 [Candidatus Peribacteria bacterium]|nr:hypothetical protein [Candidatus Peribacteria bacterium]